MIRVLIVDPFQGYNGPAQFCYDMFQNPVPDGFSVLILRNLPGLEDSTIERTNCVTRIISHTGMIPTMRDWRNWLKYPIFSLTAAVAILRAAKSFRPDIIWSNTELNPIVGVLARLLRVPSVARVHAQTMGRHGRFGRMYVCGLGRLFDILACNSISTMQYIANLGVPQSKLKVLYNAVDTCRFSRCAPSVEGRKILGSTLNDFLAVCVAHHAPIKGVHVLLDAFEQLARQHRDVHLTIVGALITPLDKQYSDSLYARVGDSEILRQRVTFCAPSNRIHQVLQQADVVVQPSLSEAAGRVVIEASSCGISVIASDTGGVKEAVVDGKTGWLVPPGDAVSLASALTEAYAVPALRKQLGAAGIEYSSKYTKDIVAKEFYAICSSACQSTLC